MATSIEWTDETWNPLRGCSRVSEGCRNCYAEGIAARFSGEGQPYEGLAKRVGTEPRWTGKVIMAPDKVIEAPLHWREPRRVFVNSMSDLFQESVPDEWIDRVFAMMALCPQHTFQILTKRPERMRSYIAKCHGRVAVAAAEHAPVGLDISPSGLIFSPRSELGFQFDRWPLRNVWLGVSIEDQSTADTRKPLLAHWREGTAAARRFLSCEPLLGPVVICGDCARGHKPRMDSRKDRRHQYHVGVGNIGEECGFNGLDWVIFGGESGPGARPMHPDWARSLRGQCRAAGVPFFFKQWGEWKNGSDFKSDAKAVLTDGRVVDPDQASLEAADRVEPVMRHNPTLMRRVGKKAAGDLLDGVQHHEWPGVA